MGAKRTAALALLLGMVLTGCDGILGIEGFAVGCLEPCGKGFKCSAGACVPECTPGEKPRCQGTEAQVCNDAGAWQTLELCSYACVEGACKCKPDEERCLDNRPEVCADNGTWQGKPEQCSDQTCKVENGVAQCKGVCAPGKRCLGATPQVCSDIGEWEDAAPCDIAQVCIDGTCGCIVKDQRCFENKRQTCNEAGQWHDDETCMASTCNPATLKCEGDCVAGEQACKDAKTPQRCSAKGQWQEDPPCAIACVDGVCTGCVPGEVDCEGNTPRTCGMDGQWQVGTACEGKTCVMGICEGECAPGKRCLGNTPQTCNEMGQWEGSTPCAAGLSCSGGLCTCIEGDRRCFDNTPQVCNAMNQWEDLAPRCILKTCDAGSGECVGECEVGTPRCQDANTAQTCTAQGAWGVGVTCGALGCVAGQCAACQQGQIRCTGNTPQTCGADGQWKDEAECVEQTCLGGTCGGQCTFGDIRCAGKWPQVCDGLGVWQVSGQPCAQDESCYQGQCVASCTPGTKRCAGDYPQTCDGNGTWQSDGAPCGKCVACDSATGMCGAEPMPLTTCNEPLAIAAGDVHTCALFPNGKVKCWGGNDGGQLGLGDKDTRGDGPGEMGQNLPFVELGLDVGITVAEISAGDSHTCARTSDGRVKCWGNNGGGQLGLGDKNNRGDGPGEMGENLPFVDLGLPAGVTVAEISASALHTCARMSNGRVKCWGGNDYGQLGLGDKYTHGHSPGQMGKNLPFVDLGLAAGVTVAEISADGLHTCARTSDGGVKCWGRNTYGQLGLGDQNNRGDGPGEMGQNLPFVDLNLPAEVTVAEISAGEDHTCARTSDGRIKCWGANGYGQLGLGDQNNRGDGPGEMGQNLPFVDLDLPAGVTVAEISAGYSHTCARTSDGRVRCWGYNGTGVLGLGDENDRGDNSGEMSQNLPFVDLGLGATATTIRAGGYHTCALLKGGSVKCWGGNFQGQLGLFDTLNRGGKPNEMGDSLPVLDL